MAHIDPDAVAIGRAVRGVIAQAGMTQEEVAIKAGFSLATMSRRINGALSFTWTELVQIARVTGSTPVEMATAAERVMQRTEAAAV